MSRTARPGEWIARGRRCLYTSEWVNVWMYDVELPDGSVIQHHVLQLPRRSVAVVVIDRTGQVLLIWRYRFITDSWGWEVPAGWVEDGELPIVAARREVEEETGWTPTDMTELVSYKALPGLSDHHFTVFLARGASQLSDTAPDSSETTRVEWVPITEFGRLIRQGLVTDGPSLTALGLALALSDLHPGR